MIDYEPLIHYNMRLLYKTLAACIRDCVDEDVFIINEWEDTAGHHLHVSEMTNDGELKLRHLILEFDNNEGVCASIFLTLRGFSKHLNIEYYDPEDMTETIESIKNKIVVYRDKCEKAITDYFSKDFNK